jgi:SAM-dependent methyltransferase
MGLYDGPIPERFFPEIGVAGFSHIDGTVGFYSIIAAALKPGFHLLEFGAGRGEHIADDPVVYRRSLTKFRGRVERVVGADVDPVVACNPYVDEAVILTPGAPLPFPDSTFDIIVSRYVFEHIDNAEETARELMRVLKPGGLLCAVTPNKWGYVAIGARLVPNRLHAKALTGVQPGRDQQDVFPTRYRMNTVSALRSMFGHHGKVMIYRASGEPAYYFGKSLPYAIFLLLHKLLPPQLATAIQLFVQKAGTSREV